ncbi:MULTISPECIES: SDR family NAD(P)-dependent oxidoreductase [unclassified Rhodococcus (in: high G+C Gram-positive bacteria)]|uniref:SDR family NAD(P)-dependent oxidoreductase n=1 Tax=unclassified Rhodococcus (in: high G+C Gram-positive bacteria) TaxID=192944 RepID=UPI001CAA8620|nr:MULTISPECIES: SDR family NAD(P)-dependent oxidoreductase [unclassified Rhodococcus (in: high G+C Gram-positive bacteria)]MDI9927561.1 SDR family NAD(P)-dependent oxidoreductase [Rhodococcus sp. IEGM 1341]
MLKIAVVTGSTRGIGAASAAALGRAGFTVVVTGRSRTDVDTSVEQLKGSGIDASGVVLDVTSPQSVAAAAIELAAQFGHIDVLVNNAGVLPEATSQGASIVDPTVAAGTFATNVIGPLNVIEEFLPLIRKSTAGRIVNVTTRMGSLAEQADPTSPYYSMVVPAYQASKAALNSVTISLSKSLADNGIVVTSVCPGFVQTDLTPVNRDQATTTPEEAARVIVAAATLPSPSESGTFIDADGPIRW